MSRFVFGGGISITTTGTSGRVGAMPLAAGQVAMVNGQRIVGPCTLAVEDGRVLVDGQPHPAGDGEGPAGPVRDLVITIEGNVQGDVRVDQGRVDVRGAVGGKISTMSGSVHVGGDVQAGGVSTMSGRVEVAGSVLNGAVSSMSGRVTTGVAAPVTVVDDAQVVVTERKRAVAAPARHAPPAKRARKATATATFVGSTIGQLGGVNHGVMVVAPPPSRPPIKKETL
jgi:hypothetical protein